MTMKMKLSSLLLARRASVLIIITAALLLSAAVPQAVWAHASGITGYSGNTATHSGAICTACHSGGTVPTVTITGPASLAPGASGTYTLMITGGPAVVGGLDVSASAGTLAAGDAATQLMSGEITQKSATSFTSGALSFTFALNAPATAGTVTLYGAGLSANGNGSTSGDNAAKATLAVTVAAATAPSITVADPVAPANDLQMAFGTVTDGVTSSLTVTVGNSGNANLVTGTIGGVNPLSAPFSIINDNCSNKTIAPSGTCTFAVQFAPTSPVSYAESFDIPSNDPSTPSITFAVSGTGSVVSVPQITVTDPVLPANDLTLPFGMVQNGLSSEQTVTVSNGGNANLVIGAVASVNPLAAPFSMATDNCSGKTLAPSGSCTLTVQFTPTQSGTFYASFDIPSNDPSTPSITFNVNGSGNNPPTAPQLLSPTDGQTGVGTNPTLEWKPSTDPDGDAVTYHVYCCTDSTFASCTPVDVAMRRTGIYLALSGLLFVGFAVRKGARGKAILLILIATLLLTTGVVLSACGTSGGTTSTASSTAMTHQVSGLTGGSTYYWKVVADDGKGGLASSPTWSFSAQ